MQSETVKGKLRKTELRQIVERFKGAKVMVWGDIFIDHYIWGRVDRISPEAPVVVVNVKNEERRLGGAGNVARNLVALGAEVSFCGVVGKDEPGRELREMLNNEGVDTKGLVSDVERSTIVKSRVIAHSQQVVRVDYEKLSPLSPAVAAELSSSCREIYASTQGAVISDYGKGSVTADLLSDFGKLYDSSHPVLVDPKPSNFKNYGPCTVIKPNRAEASQCAAVEISGRESAKQAASALLKLWPAEMVLITLGEGGMLLAPQSGESIEVDTVAREVFDVSGAGDTVSAVFLLSLVAGATPLQACVLSNLAAGIVVAEVGTVAVQKNEMLEKIEEEEWQ